MLKHVAKIKEYVILGIVFLFPLFVSNIFIDQIQLPKLILLVVGLCLCLLLIALEIFLNGKIVLPQAKFDMPILLLMFAYLISAILITPNKIEAFFSPGNALFVVGLGILYFLVNTIENKNKVKIVLLIDGIVLTLTTLMNFLGVYSKLSFLPAFTKAPTFNLTGDFLTSAVFIIATLPFGINFLLREKKVTKKLFYAFSLALLLVGTGISIFTLFSADKSLFPVLPPLNTSWSVAIETIKENPILGIGPGNYLTAFDRFRPVAYNSTNLWQLRFSSGRDLYLTILTETGILGAIGIGFLLLTLVKSIEKSRLIYKQSRSLALDVPAIALLVSFLIFLAFFPASPTSLMLLFVLISINSKPVAKTFSIESAASKTPKTIASLVILASVLFVMFKSEPILLAEYRFKQAYDALAANDGKKTYDLLGQAINLDPYVDRYHASYAQVNLAIARSVASSVKDPKDLTDNQKSTITTLIQQAIKEGQATVALNQTRSANWEILSNVYQVIIPFAAQADTFAIQSYSQTINLDPINPNLRINLGQIYYSLGRYDEAINAFQLAILAKQDLANSHYNLAIAYRDNKQVDKAIAEIQTVLTLVKKGSPDYTLAQDELDSLNKKKTTTSGTNTAPTTSLTTPQKQAPATINPPIKLPESASPPTTTEGGLPIPTPTP